MGIRRRCGADRAAGDGGSLVGDVASAESGIQTGLPLARKLEGKAGEHIELPRVREQSGLVGSAGNGGVHLALGKGAGQVERQHITERLHAVQIQAVPLRAGIDVVRPDRDVPGKVLVDRGEVGLLQELVAGHQVATLPRPAGRLRCLVLVHAAAGDAAVAQRGFIAGEIAAQDDVDHTADGVGAVDGRGAIGEDLHALDGTQRNQRDVDVLIAVRGGHAVAVDQRQRGARAEATQVDGGALAEVVAGIAVDAEVADVGAVGTTAEVLRQLLEELLQRGHPGSINGLPVDHDDRGGAAANGIADVAANDHHLVQRGGIGSPVALDRTAGSAGILRHCRRVELQSGGQAGDHQCRRPGGGCVVHAPVHRSHRMLVCGTSHRAFNRYDIAYHSRCATISCCAEGRRQAHRHTGATAPMPDRR